MDTLNTQDLQILIEAVEAWENKDLAGDVMSTVFGAMLMPKDDSVAAARYKAEEAERRAQSEEKRQDRKQQSVILRAKLFGIMKGQREAEFTKTFAVA